MKDAAGPGTETVGGTEAAMSSEEGEAPGADLARILPGGGSFMWAIRDEEKNRGYLFNGPQLGFAIPELFFEFEIHSPVQDARGVSAAGVPLVAIGHNGKVAWGYTSGLSDEDDLFAVETEGDETYDFRGDTRQMSCRDETFDYKTPPTSLPDLIDDPGLPAGTVTERICRTTHGPVQFRGEGVAYARRYAIWKRELETFTGLTAADGLRQDLRRRQGDAQGDLERERDGGRLGRAGSATGIRACIPLRPKRWDERLPFPGNGRAEWRGKRGLLPRSKTPHVVNPERNWLANWNNVPSAGWTNGDAPARERTNGNLHRVRLLQSLVRRVAKNPSYKKSRRIELTSGTTAQQFPFVNRRKLRTAKRLQKGIGARTIAELLRWDGNYDRTDDAGTVAPGVSIWEEFKTQLEAILLKPYGPAAEPLAGGTSTSHEYDITPGEAIALRRLGPKDYLRAALRTGESLSDRFDSKKPRDWRAPRLMYDVVAQGAAAPPELPFFDRGTWSQSLSVGRR